MQDWVYFSLHSMELTLELHENKEPPAADLPQLWEDNKLSLMRYLEMVSVDDEAAGIAVTCLVTHTSQVQRNRSCV